MRDRLIELLDWNCGWIEAKASDVADHLIANGVTVQEWISVKDRLPEDVYGKDREQIVVLVCTKSGKVSQCARMADYECIADETLTKVEWIKNGKFYWSKNKAVTHWMPLPQPPKGE
jgi:hypothetical protein